MNESIKSVLLIAEILYDAKCLDEIANTNHLFYEMILFDRPAVLRITECSENRNAQIINLELKWLAYLSRNVDNVAKLVLSVNNNAYETIEHEGKKYIVGAFEKAIGQDGLDIRKIEKSIICNLGKAIGKIHSATKRFNEYDANDVEKFAWYNNEDFLTELNIDECEVNLFEEKYFQKIKSLCMTKENYGVIHADIHTSNFFVDNGNITIIDFNDSEFNWYVADVAYILFQYAVQCTDNTDDKNKERIELTEQFLTSFLKGYIQENTINKDWLCLLEIFVKYRRIMIYKVVCKQDWNKEYAAWLKSGILRDAPLVEIDYIKIMNSVYRE